MKYSQSVENFKTQHLQISIFFFMTKDAQRRWNVKGEA